MGTCPATVIVDVLNVYGNSGRVLGRRYRPDPDGIAAALQPYGFQVDKLVLPIAVPDLPDLRRVRNDLLAAGRRTGSVSRQLVSVTGTPCDGELTTACDLLHGAAAVLADIPAVTDLATDLGPTNAVAEVARRNVNHALTSLGTARDKLVADSRLRRSVDASWVGALDQIWRIEHQLVVIEAVIASASSYAYGARNNLEYQEMLHSGSWGCSVDGQLGRFRPGLEGGKPGEKQIDTLCAIACVEQTRRALDTGTPRAVILVSDDDDLTPALCASAMLSSGSSVRVMAMGTGRVLERLQSRPLAPDRPRWAVLDHHAWCRIAGLDPSVVVARRHELAQLSEGTQLQFDRHADGEHVVTASGLLARTGRGAGPYPAWLGLEALDWSVSQAAVPTPVVSSSPVAPMGVRATCRSASRSRLGHARVPVHATSTVGLPSEIRVPAPGWWWSDDEIVVARSPRSGEGWRILGPGGPRSSSSLSSVHRGRVLRLRTSGKGTTWATVAITLGDVLVLVHPGMGLAIGDEVAVVPYERFDGTATPRAVLVSSAL